MCVLPPSSGHTASIFVLKMEAVNTSQTSVYFNETRWHCIPEGSEFKLLCSSAVSPLMVIMLMECDYISELRPPMGLFFILQMIYEHGET
jgi:acyl-CoA thioesterase FadM